jgi:hypothetical protein
MLSLLSRPHARAKASRQAHYRRLKAAPPHRRPLALLIPFLIGLKCVCRRPFGGSVAGLVLRLQPIVDVLADHIFGYAVAFLDFAFELVPLAIDPLEVIVG